MKLTQGHESQFPLETDLLALVILARVPLRLCFPRSNLFITGWIVVKSGSIRIKVIADIKLLRSSLARRIACIFVRRASRPVLFLMNLQTSRQEIACFSLNCSFPVSGSFAFPIYVYNVGNKAGKGITLRSRRDLP